MKEKSMSRFTAVCIAVVAVCSVAWIALIAISHAKYSCDRRGD